MIGRGLVRSRPRPPAAVSFAPTSPRVASGVAASGRTGARPCGSPIREPSPYSAPIRSLGDARMTRSRRYRRAGRTRLGSASSDVLASPPCVQIRGLSTGLDSDHPFRSSWRQSEERRWLPTSKCRVWIQDPLTSRAPECVCSIDAVVGSRRRPRHGGGNAFAHSVGHRRPDEQTPPGVARQTTLGADRRDHPAATP